MLNTLQIKLIELDRKKEEVKRFYEEYANTVNALVAEHGIGFAFQDPEGVVYQLVELEGKWVNFERFGVERTRRTGETRGSMSLKKARELGFNVTE